MKQSDKARATRSIVPDLKFFTAVILACIVGLGFGYLEGSQGKLPGITYEDVDHIKKNDVVNACETQEKTKLSDCIYEKIRSSNEAQLATKDLQAQQWMVRWAAILTLITFGTTLISWVALRYLRDTFRETSRGARATAEATIAMKEANRINAEIVATELRPFLFVDKVSLIQEEDDTRTFEEDGRKRKVHGAFFGQVEVLMRNAGKIPARNIHVFVRTYRSEAGRKFFGYRSYSIEAGYCAPGYTRRIFTTLNIPRKERQRYNHDIVRWVMRLTIIYFSDDGRRFVETAGFYRQGIHDEFFLFDRHRLPPKSEETQASFFYEEITDE